MNNSLQTNKINHFLRCCIFIQDSESLPLIIVGIFCWIWAREVKAQTPAFSAAARGWCLAEGTAVWTALCASYQGMPTESLFVCFTEGTGGGGASLRALKCVFHSCCTISFHILNLLAHFYAPCWPHHHHIKHDFKKEKTGGGSILVLPVLPSLLLPTRLPSFSSSLPHFSYPTKSNKWKTNQGSVAQKNSMAPFPRHTHKRQP